MPGRVTVVFEAQTQEALAKIQQFVRGTQDAFDKLNAGDPILQHASASTMSRSR